MTHSEEMKRTLWKWTVDGSAAGSEIKKNCSNYIISVLHHPLSGGTICTRMKCHLPCRRQEGGSASELLFLTSL